MTAIRDQLKAALAEDVRLERNPKHDVRRSASALTSADVNVLCRELRKLNVGDVATYEAMSLWVGRDVRDPPYAMCRARKALLREGIVLDTVPKVGTKRLNDSEAVRQVVARDIERARRRARRAVSTLAVLDYDKLPDHDRVEFNALASVGCVINEVGRARNIDKVRRAVTDHVLPVAKTLELFR